MEPIRFNFNFDKALQATAYFLRLAGGEMSYLKLLKLLYIAEREYLVEEHEMITGDRVSAMKYGPVLNNIYSLIKKKGDRAKEWAEFIAESEYRLALVIDPGSGRLCRAEIDKIADVFRRYGKMDRFLAAEMTHDFPEWANNFDTNSLKKSFPIPVEDILSYQNQGEMIDKVRERQGEVAHYENLFGAQR